jgi:arylsulfatase A-like enzyme
MSLKLHLLLIVVVQLSIGSACDEPQRFRRLVDFSQRQGAESKPDNLLVRVSGGASYREGGASGLPSATIDHDTRHVLAAHPHQVVADREGVLMPKPGLALFRKSMVDLFPGAENLLVNVRIFVGGEISWRSQPPIFSSLDDDADEQILFLEIPVDDVPDGAAVQIWADAYQVPPVGGSRYVTPARRVPHLSRLEFAFGILEEAVFQGPVRFLVSACEQDVCTLLFEEVLDPELEGRASWQERSVSLSPVWGQTLALKFEAVPERVDAMSLPVWANPTVVTEPEAPTGPNVILLSIDTLRRDHLSAYGYERETTPYISDHLAANGAVFENLVSEAATTEPSHMTLFTSLPALVHGMTSPGVKLGVPAMTLAEAFRDQGYETGAFAEGGPLTPELGFGIGFDRWMELASDYFFFPKGNVDRVFAQAWDWIVLRRDRPFFLFLHTFQVHFPLTPPRAYRDYFLDGDDDHELSEESMKIARYDQEIRYVDDELAKLWTRLEDRGLTQNTILVLLSDHGDEFWEHGERGHGSLPYEEVLNVPLIFVGPTVTKGLRSREPLHHVDIMPTILELAGIPVPQDVLGRSFADSVRGREAGGASASRVRTSVAWALPDGISAPAFVVRDERFKVIRYEREGETLFECFDLEKDPGEQVNLCIEGPTDDVAKLLSSLTDYEVEMKAKRTSLSGVRDDWAEAEKTLLAPEQEAQLRALGYIE